MTRDLHSDYHSYLSSVGQVRARVTAVMRGIMKARQAGAEMVVVTGVSGIAGMIAAYNLGMVFGVVRREEEMDWAFSHAQSVFEGKVGLPWVFVDDFISSGDTLRRVKKVIEDESRCAKVESVYMGFVGSSGYFEQESRA